MITARRVLATALALLVLAWTAGCADDETVGPPSESTTAPPASGSPPTGEATDPERAMERTVFELVNGERRERGLEPLSWDDQLADLARQWSRHMADTGDFEHQDLERMLERSEGFTGVGENIFRATGPVPASTIHVGWMRSDGHRANVLRPDFGRLGVGFVCTEGGEVWATQRFGSTDPTQTSDVGEEIPPQEPIVAPEGEGPSCPGSTGPVEIELR